MGLARSGTGGEATRAERPRRRYARSGLDRIGQAGGRKGDVRLGEVGGRGGVGPAGLGWRKGRSAMGQARIG